MALNPNGGIVADNNRNPIGNDSYGTVQALSAANVNLPFRYNEITNTTATFNNFTLAATDIIGAQCLVINTTANPINVTANGVLTAVPALKSLALIRQFGNWGTVSVG